MNVTLPLLGPSQADLVGAVLGFFFTVALLTYIIGDNPVYRVALHLFIGVSVGYVTLVVIYQVLGPRLFEPLLSTDPVATVLAVVPLVLFLFLIFKLAPGTSALGNVGVAYLLGVGAAVAVAGAITGTLLTQIESSWTPNAGNLLNHVVILAGTVLTLYYFQFWVRGRTATGEAERLPFVQFVSELGKGFMVITLGAIYGGMILSGLAVLGGLMVSLSGWIAVLLP